MTFVDTLEPTELWRHFDRILTIPRGSKEEERIRQYVIGEAERDGLEYQADGVGNLVIRKPGTAGREGAPITILQSHLDMVNEKNSDVDHDFSKDAIEPYRDGEYLTAKGTTLGSDNGIGIAAMLAIMEAREIAHGPLELLFTIDEESGLTGAAGLSGDMLRGRQLINLDSEEEGALCVGCAGGADSTLTLPLQSTPAPADATTLRLRLHGLKGGHSGVDIHLQRGNAVKLLARALQALLPEFAFRLAVFEGGGKHNAIPREAFATVLVPGTQDERFRATLEGEFVAVHSEFRSADPGMELDVAQVETPDAAWDEATTRTVLRLVTALPHGVMAMSYDIPDLVETSTNLATVAVENGVLRIGLSSRSSVDTALAALRQRIRAVGELAGVSVAEEPGYPGWKPDLESRMLEILKQMHQRELGTEPEIMAIHAGLECGIIGEKVPGMDMISIGPQIEFPHSPDERVQIGSVERFFRLLTATLEVLGTA